MKYLSDLSIYFMQNLIFIWVVLIFASCGSNKETSHEFAPEASNQEVKSEVENPAKYFGAKISREGAVPANTLIALMGNQDSLNVKIRGEITEVCQKKGCWMMMDLGANEEMRVTFKNYGFFVPKDMDGESAVVEGVVKKEITDVATLQHYAQDAGKDASEVAAITEPEENLVFIAEGVIFD